MDEFSSKKKPDPRKRTKKLKSSSESSLSKLIIAGLGAITALFILKLILGSLSNLLRDFQLKLNSISTSQNKTLVGPPRYGLKDIAVNKDQATIILRDNGTEDGDYVTLFINGQAYTKSTYITKAGKLVVAPLKPGKNLVQIRADKDGTGGITVAIDVNDQSGNTSSVIPQGDSAAFHIVNK